MTAWGTPEETERRHRIQVAVWAYAYEFLNTSLVSDARFDETAKLLDVNVSTGNKKLDRFFKTHFADCTGQWVHKHPEKNKLARLAHFLITQQSKGEPT